VDNALDACEEAQVLPDIYIGIKKISADVFRIVVEDNGPGIVPAQIPFVFGKLLYGSRFHQIKQSRGQQGIGISAAVLYAQLTTGIPSAIISRTGPESPANRFILQIHIESNEPEILSAEEVPWDRSHGTRVQIEFKSTLAARKRLLEYLKYTSIVNPHARIRVEIEDETFLFERVSDEPIACPEAIQPHPHGIEIGHLKRMTQASDAPLGEFLAGSFSRVGKKTAEEICRIAGLPETVPVRKLTNEEQKRLIDAMQQVKVPAPPSSQCLSPIGEDLIRQGLEKEFQMDFVRARTRPGAVFSGHPFLVEAAIGYGGKLDPEGTAQILRFANRVPLMYQQGACAITASVASVNWKSYGISQSGLPTGPLLILVHVASTNVPFTSESKDAIAGIPEIERDVVLVLQELGRELKTFLSRRDRNKLHEDRARAICAIIPEIAGKVSEIVELPPPDISPIEGRIMKRLVAKRWVADDTVHIEIYNYSAFSGTIALYDISHDAGADAVPAPDAVSQVDEEFTKLWQVSLEPGSVRKILYRGSGGGSLMVRGIEPGKVAVIDLDV
jgi:DNA topoisomerase VI subunit B